MAHLFAPSLACLIILSATALGRLRTVVTLSKIFHLGNILS
jgi:hypothetical protein